MKVRKNVKIIVMVLFVIYIAALLFVLFGVRYRGERINMSVKEFSEIHINPRTCNMIPFKTIAEYVNGILNHTINQNIAFMNLGVNLILFLPMGMAVPVLFDKRFNRLWKVLLFIAALSFGAEVVQLFTSHGSADIDDVILNTLGGAIGYGVVHLRPVRNILMMPY